MPITIYVDDDSKREVAWLCEDDWQLSSQIAALGAWLGGNDAKIPQGRYIADIGFSVRPDATGGGATISPDMMRHMADLGISLFLSEYPGAAGPHERAKT
jgi:hypothetical protein